MATDDRLYFRQLLSGRDFAVADPIAQQMVNFVYAIGDRATGECVLVDPAYGVDDLVDVAESELVAHDPGDVVTVGEIEIELVHTPGHTPGSQCFLVEGRLVSGDTLFLEGCGRTDLPGSDPGAMYDSLQRLATLPSDTIVFPGHRYSMPSSASMEA